MILPITILFPAHSSSHIYSSGIPLGIGLQSLCLHDYHVKINKKVCARVLWDGFYYKARFTDATAEAQQE